MFSTLKLRRGSPDRKKRDGQNKNSTKWSERGFCLGVGGSGSGNAASPSCDNDINSSSRIPPSTNLQQSAASRRSPSNRRNSLTRDDDVNGSVIGLHHYRSSSAERLNLRRHASRTPTRAPLIDRRSPVPGQRHQSNFHNHQQQDEGLVSRVVGISLTRDSDGLGINLRGGLSTDGACRPIIVTFIKPDGPADRDGTLRVGDRLLAADGHSLSGMTLAQVETTLSGVVSTTVVLSVEYDVSILCSLRSGGSPLIVDVEPGAARTLGLGLIDSNGRVIVSSVKPASLADRCGALLPGDHILAVNETRIDSSHGAADVTNMIRNSEGSLLQLEILPVPSVSTDRMSPSPSWSQMSTSRHSGENQSVSAIRRSESPCPTFITHEQCQELKVEFGVVTLHTVAGQGFGLRLRWVPAKMAAVISDIEPNGVADRSGVLQIGDRVTSVNGCRPGDETEMSTRVVLEVQFDVEIHPSVEPGTAVSIQLARSHASGFGITINGCPEYPSSIVITGIKWGSVGHRSGRLSVGDHLLAIGDTHLNGDIHLATSVLQHCPNIVAFVILKHPNNIDLGYSSSGLPSVDSTVETWDDPSTIMESASEMDQQMNYSSNLRDPWKRRMTQSLHSLATQQSVFTDAESTTPEIGLACIERVTSSNHHLHHRNNRSSSPMPAPPSPPCPLRTNYRIRKDQANRHWRQSSSINNNDIFADLEALEAEFKSLMRSDSSPTFLTFRGGGSCGTVSASGGGGGSQSLTNTKDDEKFARKYTDVRRVSLYKDPVYEDFGFSVSDGLFEKGVFINRIRPSGPADQSRLLNPFDRIVQVNDTNTEDFDCCLTVPLVASSPEPLVLTVVRQRVSNKSDEEDHLIKYDVDVHAQIEPMPNYLQSL